MTDPSPRTPVSRTPIRTFRCGDDLWSRASVICKRRHTSLSTVLRYLLAEWVAAEERRDGADGDAPRHRHHRSGS